MISSNQHLRVGILEWDKKTADELAAYIRYHYYAEVECVDGNDGDRKAVEEIRKFKPHVFIVAQIANPLLDYSNLKGLLQVEIGRHVEVCRDTLATFQRRPYLVSIFGGDKIEPKEYKKFKGRCQEWGYDAVCKRSDVNNHLIAIWFRRAREIYGEFTK